MLKIKYLLQDSIGIEIKFFPWQGVKKKKKPFTIHDFVIEMTLQYRICTYSEGNTDQDWK